jgi:hypothetical protein
MTAAALELKFTFGLLDLILTTKNFKVERQSELSAQELHLCIINATQY